MSTYIPWEGVTPRAWQAECLPIAQKAILARIKSIIEVVTGGGKSFEIRELCRWWTMQVGGVVTISAPVRRLVDQLHDDIENSATWDGRGKTVAPIIIACNPSLKTVPYRDKCLLIIDEAHMTNNEQFEAGVKQVRPVAMVGLTATPFGPDDRTSLTHWDKVIYKYGFGEALRDGIIVPWRIIPWTGPEVTMDEACVEMIATAKGPGLVNADSIVDAEAFLEKLKDAGINAAVVHSRMGKGVYEETVKRLLAGELSCAVHVNMLAVGVNIPPLRWLCARRNVRSKTRFPQEVGRVLRTAPGKEYATIYDPGDLFGSMSLTNEAKLGGAPAPEPYAQPDDMPDLEGLEPEERKKVIRKTKTMHESQHALRVLMQAMGTIYGVGCSFGEWREDEPSDGQLNALRGIANRLGQAIMNGQSNVPEHALDPLRYCFKNRRYLTKGEVSDMLGIMLTLHAKGWNEQLEQLWPRTKREEVTQ